MEKLVDPSRGSEEFNKGEYGKAIITFTKIINDCDGMQYVICFSYLFRALAFFHGKRKFEKAIDDLTSCIRIGAMESDDMDIFDLKRKALGYRGGIFRFMERLKIALDDYNMSLEMKRDADFLNGRGLVYEDLKDLKLAKKDYSEAIELNPARFISYSNRGNVHLMMGDYKNALSDYSSGVKLASNIPNPLVNRAYVYLVLENYELCLNDLNTSIKVAKEAKRVKFFWVHGYRALYYYAVGEYDKGLKDCKTAIEMEKKFNLAYNVRGLIYLKMGKIGAAKFDYERAWDKNTGFYNTYILVENHKLTLEKIMKSKD